MALMPMESTSVNVPFPAGGVHRSGSAAPRFSISANWSTAVTLSQNNVLRMAERNMVTGNVETFDLIPGVMGLRARYGLDTTGDGVLDDL
jgi:hypothetical protein